MEESSDKTENATPQRLREAHEKGTVARSPELAVLIALCVAAGATLIVLPGVATRMADSYRTWIAQAHQLEVAGTPGTLQQLAAPGLDLVAAIAISVGVLVVAAAATYGGIPFSGTPLKPDFSRLNPAKGLKRIFSRHTLAETAKSLLKTFALLLILYVLALSAIQELMSSQPANLKDAASGLASLALKALGWLIALQLLVTLWDLWYSHRRHLRQLRMSRRDIKDEYRRQEGDPEIRRKRKQIYSSLVAQMKALGSVKDSDVVLTNPTHVAVALRYRPGEMDAPAVACAGHGNTALLIRALARRHGIPIVRNPPLARALARQGQPGRQIAREHQQQVVFIYRWLLSRPDFRQKLNT